MSSANTDVVCSSFAIINKRGLHARASSKFVKCAEAFDAEVTVEKDGVKVPGTSIMGLMLLAASTGTEITISATGADRVAAVKALGHLVENRFDEGE
ncbi:MAG: HPr family phosphocarrier protein [Pseudomonadota bacterium]